MTLYFEKHQTFFVLNLFLWIIDQLIQDEFFFDLYDVIIILVLPSIPDQLTVQVYKLLDHTINKNTIQKQLRFKCIQDEIYLINVDMLVM